MKVVYVDETGHDAKSTRAAVAGVLLDPDRQWHGLAERIEALKGSVPIIHREGFFFHASKLFYGAEYRQSWSDPDRWSLLEKLVALPRELRIPLVLGFTKNDVPDDDQHRKSKVVHAMAYGFCLKAADWFMENHAPPNEVAMVVAEDRKEAREAIKATHRLLVNAQLVKQWLPPFMHGDFPITRIKNPPAFASKEDEVLLQISDACAFVFKRFLSSEWECDRFIGAMFGSFVHPTVLGALRGHAANYACFYWPVETMGRERSYFAAPAEQTA